VLRCLCVAEHSRGREQRGGIPDLSIRRTFVEVGDDRASGSMIDSRTRSASARLRAS
jgi:hypothetical protein